MKDIIGILLATIGSLVLVGAVDHLYDKYENTSSQLQAVSNIQTIVSDTENLYQGQSSGYTGLTDSVGIANKLFPTSMISGTSVIDQWGGNVTLAADSNPSFFDITFNQVPQSQCVALATKVGGNRLQSATINGTSATVPVTISSASSSCTAGKTNTLVWAFN